jgi:hypothetical protein
MERMYEQKYGENVWTKANPTTITWKVYVGSACRLWAASQKRPRTVDFLAVGHWRHNPVYKVTCRPHIHFPCNRSRVCFCSYILAILLFIHSLHTNHCLRISIFNNIQCIKTMQGVINLHHWNCPLYADTANHYMSKLDSRFYPKGSTFKVVQIGLSLLSKKFYF